MRTCTSAVFSLLLLFGAAAPAAAADLTEGIRLGAITLSPMAQLAMRYSDNIYFVPQNFEPVDETVVPQKKEADMILNAVAGLNIAAAVPSFDATAGYEFYDDTYIGYDDPEKRHGELNAINHTFFGNMGYQSPIGLFLRFTDTYLIQQAFTESDQFVDFLQGEQIHNEGRAYIGFRQGPYSNLYVHGMYMNTIDEFEQKDIYDRMIQRGELDVRFKFLPRTALVATGGGGLKEDPNLTDMNATMYYGIGGLKGQITDHILLTVKGGYAVYDFAANDDYKNYLAQTELGAQWDNVMKIALGYNHYVTLAIDTNFYSTDEVYLRFDRLWFSRLMTNLWADYQINSFSEPNARDETFIQGRADFTYRILFWMYAGCGYSFEQKVQTDPEDTTTIRHVGTVRAIVKF